MKEELKKVAAVVAGLATALVFPASTLASSSDHELPAEDDLFWRVTSSMSRPDDMAACQAAINAMPIADLITYAQQHAAENGEQTPTWTEEEQNQHATEIRSQFNMVCTMLAQMPTEMQADMALEGVTSSLFSAPDWHNVSGLYFEKTGEGRITFTNNIDFLTYRFFRFMNNFDSMVKMEDGFISLNASMVTDIKNYGAQLTMFGLNFSEIPDIYVDGKKAGSGDVEGVAYDANEGSLTFTAKHWSSYRAVAKGSKVKAMVITKLTNKSKSIRYNAARSVFRVKVKGRNLKPSTGQTIQCNLGFERATKVSYSKKGKSVICVFPMSYFSDLGTFPLTLTITGKGEVTKANAVRIR